MTHGTHLLVIDPQNDFCDLPEAWAPLDPVGGQRLAPALPVRGAHADLQRLARFVDAAGERLDAITLTLDSHHRIDVAHPAFWRRGDGGAVAPFTPITAAQVRQAQYVPRDANVLPRVLAYLDALAAGGRYTLVVWPLHCEVGTWGHNVHAELKAACARWEERTAAQIAYVFKGLNPWTEHYSALQAEVPAADDPATQLDHALLARLDSAAQLIVAGEAGSHCVKATTEHLVEHLPGGRPGRLVLLTDCMSPVAGFEAEQHAFLGTMQGRGVRLMTAAQCLTQLQRATCAA